MDTTTNMNLMMKKMSGRQSKVRIFNQIKK